METIGRFVSEENVARLAGRLSEESCPEKQELLRRLLVEEARRFGVRSCSLEFLQQHLAACARRMDRQAVLVEELQAAGRDTTEAGRLLVNLRVTLGVLEDCRNRVAAAPGGGGI